MGHLQVIVKERLLKNWHTLGHLNAQHPRSRDLLTQSATMPHQTFMNIDAELFLSNESLYQISNAYYALT